MDLVNASRRGPNVVEVHFQLNLSVTFPVLQQRSELLGMNFVVTIWVFVQL